MLEFTTKHIAKWRLRNNTNYVVTNDKMMFNSRTGKPIKQVIKGSTIGYVITGKFKSLKLIREQLEIIPKETTPF